MSIYNSGIDKEPPAFFCEWKNRQIPFPRGCCSSSWMEAIFAAAKSLLPPSPLIQIRPKMDFAPPRRQKRWRRLRRFPFDTASALSFCGKPTSMQDAKCVRVCLLCVCLFLENAPSVTIWGLSAEPIDRQPPNVGGRQRREIRKREHAKWEKEKKACRHVSGCFFIRSTLARLVRQPEQAILGPNLIYTKLMSETDWDVTLGSKALMENLTFGNVKFKVVLHLINL